MPGEKKRHSLGREREVLLEVQTFDVQPGRRAVVPHYECQICDCRLISHEVARGAFGENRLQNAEDALDLVVVSLYGAGDLLAVGFLEPRGLAEVWSEKSCTSGFYVLEKWAGEPLAGDLERVPLKLEVFVLARRRDLVFWIVLVDQVLDDREGFPVPCVPGEWTLDEVRKPKLTKSQSHCSYGQ